MTSGVSAYQHTSVTLEFFETVVRYEKFFAVEPQHIPTVLVSFISFIFLTWRGYISSSDLGNFPIV